MTNAFKWKVFQPFAKKQAFLSYLELVDKGYGLICRFALVQCETEVCGCYSNRRLVTREASFHSTPQALLIFAFINSHSFSISHDLFTGAS